MISCKIEKFLSTNTPHQKIQPFPRGHEALNRIKVCGRAPISFLADFYLVGKTPSKGEGILWYFDFVRLLVLLKQA